MYTTRVDADTYFASRLNSDAWDDSTNSDKEKALAMATASIDRLNFVGAKTDSDQGNEFPRDDDSEVPQDIKDATCLIALRLLDGIDPEMEFENLRLVSQGYSSVRTTYSPTSLPDHTLHGIVSAEAWRLIKPYLRSGKSMTMVRVS